MTVIVKRITLKDFVKPDLYPGRCPTEADGSFKVYTLIDNGKNTTMEDIKKLERNDLKFAFDTYIKIFSRVATGEPLKNMFDGNKFHKGHEFRYEGNVYSIWRFWLEGTIRVYFIFIEKKILILKTLAKRKDDLNKSEKNILEDKVKKIIDCRKNNPIQIEDKS